MNELDSVVIFAEELLAIVGVLRRHLETLRRPDAATSHATALEEFRRLATATADLSAGYHADDCAKIAAALVRVANAHPTVFGEPAVLAPPVVNALKYLFDRAAEFHRFRRITFPTDPQLAALPGLLAALQLADGATMPEISAHNWAGQAPSESAHAIIRPHRESRPLDDTVAPLDLALPMPSLLDGQGEGDGPSASWLGLSNRAAGPAPDYATREALPLIGGVAHPQRDAETDAADPGVMDEFIAEEHESDGEPGLTEDDLEAIRAFQASTLKPADPPLAAAATVSPAGTSVVGSVLGLDDIPPEMKAFFRKEAAEDVRGLRAAALHLEERPGDRAQIAEMAHIAHKLKGSAAQFGFAAMAAVAKALEDALVELRRAAGGAVATVFADLITLVDLAGTVLEAGGQPVSGTEGAVERAQALRDAIRAALTANAGQVGTTATSAAPVPPAVSDPAASLPPVPVGEAPLKLDVHELDQLTAQAHTLAFGRAALATASEEAQARLCELQEVVTRLRQQYVRLLDGERPARQEPESVAANGPALPTSAGGDGRPGGGHLARLLGARKPREEVGPRAVALERFDEFDQTVSALGEVIADGVGAAAQLAASLARLNEASNAQWMAADVVQRDVMRLRLVPLTDLKQHLHFELRQLQKATGKRVTLTVRGEETRIDRHVLDALHEPITQLLRNAIVHGIEDPAERERVGKAADGEIKLTATHQGSSVVIELRDDGRGVNPDGVVASALVTGHLTAGRQRELTDDDALQLMFEPGVTTLPEARMVGGRGIGLDEVRTQIRRLRGTIVASSRDGEGSTFTIRVPISLSTLRALHVEAGDQAYAVPFDAVERAVEFDGDTLADTPLDVNGRRVGAIAFASSADIGTLASAARDADGGASERLPIHTLGELLGFAHAPRAGMFALVVGQGAHHSAVLVDRIVEEREISVQALPRHLRRRILRGATVTAKGEIALVVDLVQLVENGQAMAATAHAEPSGVATRPADLAPRVLVVDDSETIRRSLTFAVERAGFAVETASDGVQALEAMLLRRPAVVLLDIEMPRLDGFEMLAALRSHEQLRTVPVVVLTSRAGEQHKEHARALGASAYLIKPCPQEELLRTIRAFIPEPVVTP